MRTAKNRFEKFTQKIHQQSSSQQQNQQSSDKNANNKNTQSKFNLSNKTITINTHNLADFSGDIVINQSIFPNINDPIFEINGCLVVQADKQQNSKDWQQNNNQVQQVSVLKQIIDISNIDCKKGATFTVNLILRKNLKNMKIFDQKKLLNGFLQIKHKFTYLVLYREVLDS
ncbi:hypothetical protein PPERSA_01680 [Pseudocohnilembus persalinus]|uniref:Uncharacterized protein n=1 Tax=Pseudocohnilembus persalinus TaxID=266149 RepID=A0A0V0R0S9_PSEPJ|nr:hypothetical protein PPERSA_01680 [Pseudocohnilembus persalinus]|eukprot:KRX08135.1 hypothetical protein PPERSA_01680 [Pseudocohnilembus persalinus]